jgi:hypothetical protein
VLSGLAFGLLLCRVKELERRCTGLVRELAWSRANLPGRKVLLQRVLTLRFDGSWTTPYYTIPPVQYWYILCFDRTPDSI